MFLINNLSYANSDDSIVKGLGFEIGVGQNNLYWSAPFNLRIPGGVVADRTDFSLIPNFRLNYQIYKIGSFTILPFLGYTQIGGSSDSDKYLIHVIEMGSFALFKIHHLAFGIGGKFNHHLNAKYQYASFDVNRTDWFSNNSTDVGLRTSYYIKSFTISIDVWLGLNNLANGPLNGAKIKENNYRLMIGYTI